MKAYIHSKYGVLECIPMTLQAIENSIPEPELKANNQDSEFATVSEGINTEDNVQ